MADSTEAPRKVSSLFGLTIAGANATTAPSQSPPLPLAIPAPAPVVVHPLTEAEVEDLIPLLSFLVVDDVRCSCEVLCSLLRSLGANPSKLFSATTLFGAMNLARSNEIDVVISDLHLRLGTGLDLLEAIRANPTHDQTAFMLVTNDPQANEIQKAQRLGVTAVTIKPISISNLIENLRFCLAQRPNP